MVEGFVPLFLCPPGHRGKKLASRDKGVGHDGRREKRRCRATQRVASEPNVIFPDEMNNDNVLLKGTTKARRKEDRS